MPTRAVQPSGDTYTVESAIRFMASREAGTTVDELRALNDLASNDLFVGRCSSPRRRLAWNFITDAERRAGDANATGNGERSDRNARRPCDAERGSDRVHCTVRRQRQRHRIEIRHHVKELRQPTT